MKSKQLSTQVGIFAKARKDADEFVHNLFLSHTLNECAVNLQKIQKKYDDALLQDNQDLIEKARQELNLYKSSIALTACMFEEVDEIST